MREIFFFCHEFRSIPGLFSVSLQVLFGALISVRVCVCVCVAKGEEQGGLCQYTQGYGEGNENHVGGG